MLWTRLIDTVAIVVGAWFVAGTINACARASLALPEAQASRVISAPAAVEPFEHFQPIVTRNVFFHGEPVPGEETSITITQPVEACDPAIGVGSASIVWSDPSLSVVTLIDRSQPKPQAHAVRPGEMAGTLGVVRRVWMEDFVALVEIERGDRLLLCRSDAPKAPRGVSGARGVPVATGAGIKKVSDTQYEVAQAEVDAVMAGGLMNEARNVLVVPYFESGSAAGFKLARVRPASLLAKIGLATGDVVKRINGYEISTPEKALQVYGLLKSEKRISVDVVRGGAPKTFTYVIR